MDIPNRAQDECDVVWMVGGWDVRLPEPGNPQPGIRQRSVGLHFIPILQSTNKQRAGVRCLFVVRVEWSWLRGCTRPTL